VSGEGGHGLIDGAFEDETEEAEDVAPALSLDQLSADMLTLSLVPKSRWQTLLHLDLIKQRNKPKEAPKVPEKAPFFLPSLEKPVVPAAVEEKKAEESVAERSRIMKMDRLASEGAFTIALRSGSETGNCMSTPIPFYDSTNTRQMHHSLTTSKPSRHLRQILRSAPSTLVQRMTIRMSWSIS
jgi:U3 small nucleolar RNA-associated protein 21